MQSLYEGLAWCCVAGCCGVARALVASFGFDEKFVVRAIIRHGVGSGDLIVLVTGRPTEKTEAAYSYVRDLAAKVNAEVVLRELGDKVYDFAELVAECKKLLRELLERYSWVTVLLSGGMRVIVLGLYTAVLALPRELKARLSVEIDTEDRGVLVQVPGEVVGLFSVPELGAKKRLLEEIVRNPGLRVEEYAEKLSKDESTVRRQLQALVEQGLVRLSGRPQQAEPTPAAKIVL